MMMKNTIYYKRSEKSFFACYIQLINDKIPSFGLLLLGNIQKIFLKKLNQFLYTESI